MYYFTYKMRLDLIALLSLLAHNTWSFSSIKNIYIRNSLIPLSILRYGLKTIYLIHTQNKQKNELKLWFCDMFILYTYYEDYSGVFYQYSVSISSHCILTPLLTPLFSKTCFKIKIIVWLKIDETELMRQYALRLSALIQWQL